MCCLTHCTLSVRYFVPLLTHERLFNFSRRSCLGLSTPTWLSLPGNVLLKRHVRTSKHEPLVDEVELIQATPNYARVRLPNGHEKTVTLRDIAPVSEKQYYVHDNFQSERLTSNETEIQGQPEENSSSTPSLEDQQNNDLKVNLNYADLLAIGGHRIA